jgi:hypothetical protein
MESVFPFGRTGATTRSSNFHNGILVAMARFSSSGSFCAETVGLKSTFTRSTRVYSVSVELPPFNRTQGYCD